MTLLYTGFMLVIAVVVEALLARRSLLGTRVPAWQAALPPLAWFVAMRHTLSGLGPNTPPHQVAELYSLLSLASAGGIALGAVSIIAGVVPWVRTRDEDAGNPALAEMGVLAVGASVLGGAWCVGQAELWAVVDAPPEVIATRGVEVARGVDQVAWGVLGGLAVAWPAVGIWGYRRERWRGLREGVAAAVLMAMTLSTGQAADRGREAAQDAHRRCEAHVIGASWWFSDHPVVRGRPCPGTSRSDSPAESR